MQHRERARTLLRGAVHLIHLLQLPLFMGLLLALLVFGATFFYSIVEAVISLDFLDRNKAILLVLNLLDMVFIANLVVMVMVSGYNIYYADVTSSPEELDSITNRDAFSAVKSRIAATLVIISAIHILHEILAEDMATTRELLVLAVMHVVLLATAAVLVFLARNEK